MLSIAELEHGHWTNGDTLHASINGCLGRGKCQLNSGPVVLSRVFVTVMQTNGFAGGDGGIGQLNVPPGNLNGADPLDSRSTNLSAPIWNRSLNAFAPVSQLRLPVEIQSSVVI